MKHNGIEYSVVQAANPKGWVWRFQISGSREQSGRAVNRALAIARACAAIDKAIKAKPEGDRENSMSSDRRA